MKPTILVTRTDYYPFGMMMDGRNEANGEQRYGYNGKENDNEVKGDGNSIDYGARIYDPRLGRFFCQDPLFKMYPEFSPYSFAASNPIMFKEVDGQGFNGGFSIVNNSSTSIVVKGTSKTVKTTATGEETGGEKPEYSTVTIELGQRLVAYYKKEYTKDGGTIEKYTARIESSDGTIIRSDVDAWDVDLIQIQPGQVFLQDFYRGRGVEPETLKFGAVASSNGTRQPHPPTGPGTIKLRPGFLDFYASAGDANEGHVVITGDQKNLRVVPGGEWENKPTVDYGPGTGIPVYR